LGIHCNEHQQCNSKNEKYLEDNNELVGDQATTAVAVARNWQYLKCNNQPAVTWSNSTIGYASISNKGSCDSNRSSSFLKK